MGKVYLSSHHQIRRLVRFFYRHIVFILIIILCSGVGVALAGTSSLAVNLIDSQALQSAKVSVKTLNEARILYSKNVVDRVKTIDGITVGPQYHDQVGGIPNPATYTIELGEHLSSQTNGSVFRLYSDYPFPYRPEGGPQDQFQIDALKYLKLNPADSFHRKEKQGNHLLFRYAEAVVMESSCVVCHNRLSSSPKRDWQVGDVRGVVEVSQSIDHVLLLAKDGLKAISFSLAVIAGLAFMSMLLVISYARSINQILQEEVQSKTSALQRLATVDDLTQMPNRRQFDDTLSTEWQRMQGQQQPLALMICDVDFFKKYNDAYGHQAGDECLKQVAMAIGNAQRVTDLAARYGGEEFAVILPDADAQEAIEVASRMMEAIGFVA